MCSGPRETDTGVRNELSRPIYTVLAIASTGVNGYLYAAHIHNNRIDVPPASGAPPLTGTFTDTSLPAGPPVFNIQLIGGMLYVIYAKPNAAGNNGCPVRAVAGSM
jgi:hypothetical protein